MLIVEGIVADETASINFKVNGKGAELLKLNAVVAFRNCRSDVVEER